MMFWFDIFDPALETYGRSYLAESMYRWCSEEFGYSDEVGGWGYIVRYDPSPSRQSCYTASVHRFWFDDEINAMAFKLRWI